MKSMAYSLTFQNPEDSLDGWEVNVTWKTKLLLEEKVNVEVR